MSVKQWMLILVMLVMIPGCVVVPAAPTNHRQGPPDHAPAHGYRNKYRYQYYPDAGVYFDLDRRSYFYLDGGWRKSANLPPYLRANLYGPVTIEMDSAEPYSRYDEHQHKYPPGQRKKKNKKWK